MIKKTFAEIFDELEAGELCVPVEPGDDIVFVPRPEECPPLRVWSEASDIPLVRKALDEHLAACEWCRALALTLPKLPW